MKHLIRKLLRVINSSHYTLLRSNSLGPHKTKSSHRVPKGHVPVYVGEEMERFVVNAELLNHPVFVNLLDWSAEEYGYEQKGVLRIPCHVIVFERVLEALRLGRDLGDIHELIASSSEFSFERKVVSYFV